MFAGPQINYHARNCRQVIAPFRRRQYWGVVFDYDTRCATVIDPSLHGQPQHIKVLVHGWYLERYKQALMSAMNRNAGDTMDHGRWDTVYYCPPPEPNSKDNGMAMTFYTRYFDTSACVLTMSEHRLRRHQEDLLYGIS
ncbi:unnamed protein product [Urochloa humidicola]